jgi:hypothetical protein
MGVGAPVGRDEGNGLERVPGLAFFGRQALDQRRHHGATHRLAVGVPAVEAHWRERLGGDDPRGDLRLGAALRPGQHGLVPHPTAGDRIQSVALDDVVEHLRIDLRRLPLDVTLAVTAVRLDPVGDRVAQRADVAVEQRPSPAHQAPAFAARARSIEETPAGVGL